MASNSTIKRFLTLCLLGGSLSGVAQFRLIAPEWKMTVKVIDEAGKPLSGINTTVRYHVAPPAGEDIALAKKSGQTDTNGIFVASKRSRSFELLYSASKNGYYSSGGSYDLGPDYQYEPKKWSPTVTMVLKKI